jgi:3-(3-hydroxy-phenyl)propionate hydroxylase
MNTGARDAANISWKLSGFLKSSFNDRILNTYECERRKNVEAIVTYSVRVGRIANIRSWPLAILRDLTFWLLNRVPPVRRYFSEMRYLPKPRITNGFVDPRGHDQDEAVGRMLPLLKFHTETGATRTVDELVGLSFGLIGSAISPEHLIMSAATRPWDSLAPILVSVSESSVNSNRASAICVKPADTASEAFLRRRAGKIIVLRPDGYVAGVADDTQFKNMSQVFVPFT